MLINYSIPSMMALLLPTPSRTSRPDKLAKILLIEWGYSGTATVCLDAKGVNFLLMLMSTMSRKEGWSWFSTFPCDLRTCCVRFCCEKEKNSCEMVGAGGTGSL